jgi:hypothetical protein
MASNKMIGRGTPNIQRSIPRPMSFSFEFLHEINAAPLCAATSQKSVVTRV